MFSFKLPKSPVKEVAVCPSLSFFANEEITGVQMNHERYPRYPRTFLLGKFFQRKIPLWSEVLYPAVQCGEESVCNKCNLIHIN